MIYEHVTNNIMKNSKAAWQSNSEVYTAINGKRCLKERQRENSLKMHQMYEQSKT